MKDTLTLLLLGARKSGSTYLLNLLDNGDSLTAYPYEIKFKFNPGGKMTASEFVQLSKDDLRVHQGVSERDEYIFQMESTEKFDLKKYRTLWSNLLDQKETKTFSEWVEKDIECFKYSLKNSNTSLLIKEVGGIPEKVISDFEAVSGKGGIVLLSRNPIMISTAVIRDRKRRLGKYSIFEFVNECRLAVRYNSKISKVNSNLPIYRLSYEELITPDGKERLYTQISNWVGSELPRNYTTSLLGNEVRVKTLSKERASNEKDVVTNAEKKIIRLLCQIFKVIYG